MMLWASLALASASSDFEAANKLLAEGDLPGAEAAYTQIVASGVHDADVYFNLGNVLFRQDRRVDAVLAWRRAQLLAPRDADIAANLDFVRRDFVDGIAPAAPVPAWAPWQSALTSDEGEWVGASLAAAGLLLFAFRKRVPAGPAAGIGLFATCAGLIVGAAGVAEAALPPAAVVRPASITVRSDLGSGVDLFVLHAGAEVLTQATAGDFVLIALPDGRKGWVPRSAMGLIQLDAPFPAQG